MKTKYTWILFDLDGTLFDYEKAESKAFEQMFNDLSLTYRTEYLHIYQTINTQCWHELEKGRITPEELRTKRFKLLLNALGLIGDPERCSESYLQNLSQVSVMLEGAEEILEYLVKHYRLMVVTNGLAQVQHNRIQPIAHYFHDMLISEELGVSKPDRMFFEEAFTRMDHPSKNEVLIVGDSLSSDIRGGYSYGIDTCWFNPNGLPKPDDIDITYEITSIYALKSFLSPAIGD